MRPKPLWQVAWRVPGGGTAYAEYRARDAGHALVQWKRAHKDTPLKAVRAAVHVNSR